MSEADHGLVRPLTLNPDGRAPVAKRDAADPLDYDNYFRIRREHNPEVWAHAAQRVTQTIVDDLPNTTLSDPLQRDILAGTSRILAYLPSSDLRPDDGAQQDAAPSPDLPASAVDAAHRWKTGHHLFHLILATMNTRLDQAVEALERIEPDIVTASVAVNDVTALFHAATASMHFASDFPKPMYETVIRPSMSPPWMPEGFSGIFNREHEVLSTSLRRLKAVARSTPSDSAGAPRLRESLSQLWRAQSHNRREHRLICEKFVPGGDSLLKQHFANADQQED